MLVCVAGDVHGALDRLYADVAAFERQLDLNFEWVLQVGDFGVWPDPYRLDRATRRRGHGDFADWWLARKPAPKPTLFIQGNHEDFTFLYESSFVRHEPYEVLPDLYFLPNGRRFDLGGIVVGGVGGCASKRDYEKPSRELTGKQRRHYTKSDVETLLAAGSIDLLLTHDAPAGVQFPETKKGWVLDAIGLDTLVERLRPRVACFGHHHLRFDAQLHGVTCIGLARVTTPGSLVALELPVSGGWRNLGQFP